MRKCAVLAAAIMVTFVIRLGLSNDGVVPAVTPTKVDPNRVGKDTQRAVAQSPVEQSPIDEKAAAEERAIRATADSYKDAFTKGDAQAAAAHFTPDAEYVDAQGNVYRGRQAIEDLLKDFFAANPGCKIDLDVTSLRFVGPDTAIEDGVTKVTFADDAAPVSYEYTCVHVRSGGKWQTASVRERTATNTRQQRNRLQELNWMVGEWVHEGDDAVVHFVCRPTDNGNFLVRNFTVQIGGHEVMSGSQRVGWDARAGKFRAWVFDSEGGFAEGYWHRDGEDWVLKLSGVTPDGQSASNTSIYSFVDARTMTFRSVDHEVAGIELPDSDPVTIVRRAPEPE